MDWAELEPARARMTGGPIMGGPVEARPWRASSSYLPGQNRYRDRQGNVVTGRPWLGDRCGATMPRTGEKCYRRPAHKDVHRSQAQVERDTERRRKSA
jgi:hypothetical protein